MSLGKFTSRETTKTKRSRKDVTITRRKVAIDHKPTPQPLQPKGLKDAIIARFPHGFRLLGGKKGAGNVIETRTVSIFSNQHIRNAVAYLKRYATDHGYNVVEVRGAEKGGA